MVAPFAQGNRYLQGSMIYQHCKQKLLRKRSVGTLQKLPNIQIKNSSGNVNLGIFGNLPLQTEYDVEMDVQFAQATKP